LQNRVGHILLVIRGAAKSVHAEVLEILRDFDGLVKSGEMLVVLGRPGSGCSTFLKTIAPSKSRRIWIFCLPVPVMERNKAPICKTELATSFWAKDWMKNLLAIQSRDPERYPKRQAGLAFKNLSVQNKAPICKTELATSFW
jgi:energy-coupling factor transporter ATP-binding protein EcfA2